jgi:hypothetical protein
MQSDFAANYLHVLRIDRRHMNSVSPEFIRLPEDGERCAHTGMKRGSLRNLCIPSKANAFKPAVPAKCLRQPGNLRGIWLIPYAKLVAYIEALPTPGLKQ